MTALRRVLCIPLSAFVAIAFGFGWAAVFTSTSFSKHHLLYSILGLSPAFMGRLLPVALFITMATFIAPRPGRFTIACFGILGGVFGCPFGPQYEVSTAGPVFYLVGVTGAITGAGVGVLLGLVVARCKKEANQPPVHNALDQQ